MANIDWTLGKCCTTREIVFLVCYCAYAFVAILLGKLSILKPIRLLTTFAHEFSHATACWLTGGSVKKIEVYNNEGGVTGYTGGCRTLVVPAGYVGGAFWGGAFVALSGNRIGATIVAAGITLALLFSLCFKPNGLVVVVCLCFSAINVGLILIEYFVYTPILTYFALFYGVFIGWFSVRDIYDDLIVRTAEGSDAVACHKLYPCCLPRCVGVQFWLVAFVFQGVGLYIAIVWLMSS